MRIWPRLEAPLLAPVWLPQLTDALAGQHIDQNDVSEVVPVERLYQLRQELSKLQQADYYSRWVRWFLTDGQSKADNEVR